MYIYYPSCNFRRLFPATAARVREWMQTQPDIRMAGCCRVTDGLPADGDTIVTVCMSCMRMLDEVRPEIPQISLFELLLTRPGFPWPDLRGRRFILQDCFRARGRHALHEAVRACLRHTGATVMELPANRDEADFDGTFLLHEPYPDNIRRAPRYYVDYLPQHLTPIPEAEWTSRMQACAARFAGGTAVGYCNTCVDGLRRGGADAVHLAELLFPDS